jgi:hypothetical protein
MNGVGTGAEMHSVGVVKCDIQTLYHMNVLTVTMTVSLICHSPTVNTKNQPPHIYARPLFEMCRSIDRIPTAVIAN